RHGADRDAGGQQDGQQRQEQPSGQDEPTAPDSDSTRRLLATAAWVRAVAVTPDCTRAAAVVENAGVHVIDLASGRTRRLGDATVTAVALRGGAVLTGAADGSVA
ncbi:hypothetical protein, partial [Streptomyces sp. GSL17-113]|uniref:hypothetical protein n=1 Tax=Streptomyces sp. GSL17-113 TaxID=3115365 RepID=UPI002E77839A